jgi:hypothetical protein
MIAWLRQWRSRQSRPSRYVPPIPYFSMSPPTRWFYFSFLRAILRPFPRPVWRVPATILAALSLLRSADVRRLHAALLPACGHRPTWRNRWRANWSRCYQHQADLLLLLQSARCTRAWAARHVRVCGALPPGGAILITPHHAAQRLGSLLIADRVEQLGSITGAPPDLWRYPRTDPTLRRTWEEGRRAHPHIYGDRVFTRQESGRKGLRLLAEGGYLNILADDHSLGAPPHSLIGKAFSLPRGAAWFAQHSGKSIVPFMVVPVRYHWELWLGEPVPPTLDGIAQGLAECIRHAPGSWSLFVAMAWLRMPHWREGV